MMTEHIFRTSTIAIKFCIQTRDKLQNFFTATILLPKLHLLPQSKNHPKKVLLNTGFVVSFLILGKIQKYCLNKKFELPFLGLKSRSFVHLKFILCGPSMMEQPNPAAVGFRQFTGTKAQISGISHPKLTLRRTGNTANLFFCQ